MKEPVIEAFLKEATHISCEKHTLFTHRGNPINCLYYLQSGTVIATLSNPQGEGFSEYMGAGDFFGCTEFLSRTTDSQFTIRARGHCSLFTMSFDDLRSFVSVHPTFYNYLAFFNASRTRIQNEQKLDLVTLDVFDRLKKILVEISRHSGYSTGSGLSAVGIKQGELAEIVGCCREMICLTLKKLKSEGYLDYRRDEIILYDKIFIDS